MLVFTDLIRVIKIRRDVFLPLVHKVLVDLLASRSFLHIDWLFDLLDNLRVFSLVTIGQRFVQCKVVD